MYTHIKIKFIYIFRCVLKLIYYSDDKCVICGKDIDDENPLCMQCTSHIKFCNDKFLIIKDNKKMEYYSTAYYGGEIKELIIRLKYKSDFYCGEALGEYMTRYIREKNICFDVITFIPMTAIGRRKRGYNQSEFLAKYIAESIHRPYVKCLKKIEQSKDQIGLNTAMRWENLKNCFKIRKNIDLRNKRVLLVDDVITTGATSFYCSEELKKNGAIDVIILTAAKSRI